MRSPASLLAELYMQSETGHCRRDCSVYQAAPKAGGPLPTTNFTDGGACRDIRVGSVKRFGPFDDIAAFHDCVRAGIALEYVQGSFGAKVLQVHQRQYKICFTHGDLGVQNILVRDAKVVALIDWECAGWYPGYWEYTRAH